MVKAPPQSSTILHGHGSLVYSSILSVLYEKFPVPNLKIMLTILWDNKNRLKLSITYLAYSLYFFSLQWPFCTLIFYIYSYKLLCKLIRMTTRVEREQKG